MNTKIITTPKGERLAILPADEYEDMCDALIHAEAMAEYRDGRDEGISLDEMQALLDAPTPLAFWRAKRGISQSGLALTVGATPEQIASVESRAERGSLDLMTRIAQILKIKVEELID